MSMCLLCAADRSMPTWACATSPSTRSPSRYPEASWSTAMAASPTSRRDGCGWSHRRRSTTTPCGWCGRHGWPPSYHHLDAHGHTLEVLQRAIELEADPVALFGAADGARVAAFLAEPLADELTRGGALRWGALLHDAAKPQTQTPLPTGGFGFPGHDKVGADVSRQVLERLRVSERLRAHVAGLARHHLRLGFLVHQRPLPPRAVYDYLAKTG